MSILNWKTTPEEHALIIQIADRAVNIAMAAGVRYSKQDAVMDLTAAHANGNPLDLPGLVLADRGDFEHDVFGIRRHLNRGTGKLDNCFVPRYSKRA